MSMRSTIVAIGTRGHLTDIPAEADVRNGTSYGAGQFTGTYSAGGTISVEVTHPDIEVSKE